MHIAQLFANNRKWQADIVADDPQFFETLAAQQRPHYLWIGCSDSRVPANQIVGLAPGDLFVHRNVANVVVHTDLNCLSVLQYAVEALEIRDVLVVGHYGCGGVKAAHDDLSLGLIDNWLRHVQDVRERHGALFGDDLSPQDRVDRLTELNVIEQVRNVGQTTVVRNAWDRGQPLAIHGWIYDIHDGLLRDLGCKLTGGDDAATYANAVARIGARAPRTA